MQSVFNLVHSRPSMLLFPFAVFVLCCSTVISGYCNVSFYVLGILSGIAPLNVNATLLLGCQYGNPSRKVGGICLFYLFIYFYFPCR